MSSVTNEEDDKNAVIRLPLISRSRASLSTPKPEEQRPTDHTPINLIIKAQDGNEVSFRIKRSAKLKELMSAYCDQRSVVINSIAFLFDGRHLRWEQTPYDWDMEDGDEIDALLHQTGGGAFTAI